MSAIEAEAQVLTEKLPLAVDLDGTLIRGDVFMEAMVRFVFAAPWNVLVLIGWLMRGRAHAKARLAEASPVDAETLPYDKRVLAWLRIEKANGRTIALATASDQRAAEAVAAHLGLFSAVVASDGETNLKSRRKGEALAKMYPQGFVYAGNEDADLKVWSVAADAVVVNAPASLARRVRRTHGVELEIPRQGGVVGALIKAIRPQQWAKNILVFLPIITSQQWFDVDAWRAAGLAFPYLRAAGRQEGRRHSDRPRP
jgi:phosphoserine phosphatase